MKRFTLFTLMLILASMFSIQISLAEEQGAAVPTTEISEGTEKQDDLTKEVVTAADSDSKESYGTVSEYEINLSKMAQEKNQEQNGQDGIKGNKLEAVKAFVKSQNRGLSDAAVTKVAEAALYANQKNELDLSLILAVMWKESTFDVRVHNTNCFGLMQIHKNTARGYGYTIEDINDPYKAADLGARILKGHIRNYNNTVIGLTAYNAGSGNVKKGNYTTAYANNVIKKQQVIQAFLDNQLKNA